MKPTNKLLILSLFILLTACGKDEAKPAAPQGPSFCGSLAGTYSNQTTTLIISPTCHLTDTWCAYDVDFTASNTHVNSSNSANGCYPTGRDVACSYSLSLGTLSVTCEGVAIQFTKI